MRQLLFATFALLPALSAAVPAPAEVTVVPESAYGLDAEAPAPRPLDTDCSGTPCLWTSDCWTACGGPVSSCRGADPMEGISGTCE